MKLFLERLIDNISSSYTKWRLRSWAHSCLSHYHEKSVLSKEQKEKIDVFFKPYFKPWKKYQYHEFYSGCTGEFHVEYIPDDIYYSVIDKYYNDWDKAKKFDDKCYYDRLFSNFGIKMPETICYRINGYWLDSKYRCISEEKAAQLIMEQGKAFLKQSVESEGGHGVVFFDTTEKDIQELKKIFARLGKNLVAQAPIIQSNVTKCLNPSSVNTIRLLSFLDKDGNTKIYSGILRMGIGNSKVDNASSGGITCGIMPDGRLKDRAFKANGEKYEKEHPSSKVRFSDVQIPGYKQICDKIKNIHPQLSNFRLLSWDIALDESDTPVLVEVNMCFGELDFHQLNNGPLFGEDTEMILKEVFNHN